MGCAGVRLCVLNLISGVRVRSWVGGQICFNCWIACVRICVLNSVLACACVRGSADSSFQLLDRGRSICSRRARVRSRVSGQTCFLCSRFFIEYVGSRAFTHSDLRTSDRVILLRVLLSGAWLYMGFGFLRANSIYCSPFLIYFSFYSRADNFLPVFLVVGEEMKEKLEEVA